MKKKPQQLYMDGITFKDELGRDAQGSLVYPSRRTLTAGVGHNLADCGIAVVEVRLVKWIKRPKY